MNILRCLMVLMFFSISMLADTYTYTYTGKPFTSFLQSGTAQSSISELSPPDFVTASITMNTPVIGTINDVAGSSWWISVGTYSWSSISDGEASYFLGDSDGIS